ncbi:MAG: dephospho-CoA kinase [Chloroflexi bacterium]|nr:MAG: dephospho-CoA kinase [Chloroflexota bacterium]
MSRWGNKYVIGLTGNIAVGKSVVRQMLQHLGAYTIDADALAHRVMEPGAPAYQPIVQTFGQFILDENQRINRAVLANIVFSNPEALAKLEAITHPIIGAAIDTLIGRARQRVIVIEAIKLLEGDLADSVDTVWVVNASPQAQLQRLVQKRKMSPDDAKKRIAAQHAQADKLKRASVVIQNDGDFEATWKQVQKEWEGVKQAVIQRLQAAQPPTDTATSSATSVPAAPPRPQTPQPAAPAQPAPPAQPPAQAQPVAEPASVASPGVDVRRGMPTNAEDIAAFISQMTGKTVNRMDVMMAFGEKSYLLVYDDSEKITGLMGWQVENLITRVDEFYVVEGAQYASVVGGLVNAIEIASQELQSEVCFAFLPMSTPQEAVQSFLQNGYELTTVEDIKIPAWREAVSEMSRDGVQILSKRLREDRVLKPI